MKRSFTKLIAALALLVFMTPSLAGWGQAPVNTTLWEETWGTFSSQVTPSGYDFNGTTVYGGATLTYAQSSTNTKLYDEKLAGGSEPELLLSKSNQTWTISNIPTGQATEMSLTFLSNKTTFDVTSTTTGITISGSGKSWTITATNSVSNFNLTIKNTGGSNARIDNIVLIVTTAGGGGSQLTPSNLALTGAPVALSFDLYNNSSAQTVNFTTSSTGAVTVSGGTGYVTTSVSGNTITVTPTAVTPSAQTITVSQAADATYAAGSVNFTVEVDDSTPSTGTTATLNIQNYATANNWANGTQYLTATVNPVTFTASGGGNTGKYYTSGQDWRYYQNESASITISVPQGYTLVSVKPTYGVSNTGVLKNGSTSISSGSTVNVSGTSVTFTVGNSGSATNGQVKFTKIDVTYVADGGSQSQSDLAITGAPVALSFDLYNNSSAQTVSYTTSSTGAITIEPDSPTSYFSYVHDATNKTITVTPLAVTPSAQTVTINQAADDHYYAGTATFTVSVVNSAPLADIAALTAQTAGEYTVTLTDALVTYTNGTSAYLEDASGAVLLYHCNDNNLNLAVGDKITGTANVTYTVYNNLPEVTGFTLATGYTLTSGNTITPAVVTIADLESNYTSYISRYVKIENATVTSAFSNKNCTIEQNSSSIVLRDQNSSATLETTQGDIVTVTAHPSIFNSTHQIAVYEQSQIVVAKVNPTITFNNGSVRVGQTLDLSTLFSSNSNGAVTYSITAGDSYATLSGYELTGTADGSVTVKAAQAETTSYNAGEATATITVNPALVLNSIAVTTPPTKTTYNEGETFDPTGMVVTATYTDNSTDAVTGYTYLPDGALATTDTEITISYTENNVTKTTTQAITVNEVVDYATLPFEWEGGLPDAFDALNGTTLNGVGSYPNQTTYQMKLDSDGDYIQVKCNERPGTVTIGVKMVGGNTSSTITVQGSSDGENFTDIQVLTISGSQNAELSLETTQSFAATDRYVRLYFTKGANVGVGPISIAAYVAPGNTAPVWSALPTPTIAVNAEYELNLSTYVTGTPTPAITLTNTTVSSSLYEFENGLLVFQPTTAGTYEFTFTATNSEGNASATLTVTAAEVATYTLATSITSGRHYVIAATTSTTTMAMGGKNASKDYYDAIAATLNGNTITVMPNSGIQEFVIAGPNAAGYYYIYDPVADGYLYASSSGSNDLSYQKPNDNNGLWEIDFTANTVTAKGTNEHNLLRYNSGNPRFSCYASGQTAIAFYEKNETNPQYDFYMDIAAWTVSQTTGDENKTDGWYFIASPLASAYTLTGTNMVSGTYEDYDLYRLNNTTWENYNNNHSDFTALENGTGYLYANSQDITLHFSGAINTFTTDNNANVKSLSEGWNLIGNPYNIPIFINKPYYRMNANGDDIETEDGITSKAIPACTGVVVKATDGESVTFSTSAPSNSTGNNGNIQIALAQNAVTRGGSNATSIDNAIVSFNEGSQLEKFYFGTQNANLYIPQNGEEFAIATSDMQGEMPVNFKAAEDGEYTINVNPENVEMNYLHLIDNITGADVDLLINPSYTFNGSTNDYASRFRLVFSGNSVNEFEAENGDFAFISNGQIILNGVNENATLQMVDMTGRIVSTEQVNGNSATLAPTASGVYVLRLINGNETKTQKIVVR